MTIKFSTLVFSAVTSFCMMFQPLMAQSRADFDLTAPQGWAEENAVAEKQGLKYAFIPQGKTWEDSDVILFSNQAKLKSYESIFDYIDDDILFYTASVNDLQVKRAKVIEIGEGHNLAVVKHMISNTDGVFEAYAYIPEEGKVNFVTLRADSEEAFNKSLEKFEELVTSYRFHEQPKPGMMVDSE